MLPPLPLAYIGYLQWSPVFLYNDHLSSLQWILTMFTCLPFVGLLQWLPVFLVVGFPPSRPLTVSALHAGALTISLLGWLRAFSPSAVYLPLYSAMSFVYYPTCHVGVSHPILRPFRRHCMPPSVPALFWFAAMVSSPFFCRLRLDTIRTTALRAAYRLLFTPRCYPTEHSSWFFAIRVLYLSLFLQKMLFRCKILPVQSYYL